MGLRVGEERGEQDFVLCNLYLQPRSEKEADQTGIDTQHSASYYYQFYMC